MASSSKVFNNKRYALDGVYPADRKGAKEKAERLRQLGWLARVVPELRDTEGGKIRVMVIYKWYVNKTRR